MTYLCTTWLGQLRKLYKDVRHFPLPTWILDQGRQHEEMEQETQKLYTITSDSRGVWGQGIQGSCSLHSFLTNFFLPNLNDSLKSEWPVRREEYSIPSPHMHPIKFIRRAHWAKFWPLRVCEREEGITKSCSLEQLVLTLTLSIITSRLCSVRFRPS